MQLLDTLLSVTGEALLLLLLSRLLFAGVISSFADRRGKGFWLGLLRLPGNAVHELSHCLGFYLCGYRVQKVTLCIFDPRGRGSCKPGQAWSPVTLPYLAVGVSAFMPLVVGSVLLVAAARWLGILHGVPDPPDGQLLPEVWRQSLALLQHLDFHRWQTYVFLYFSLSVGAELAPSSTDLRYAIPTLLALAASLWLGLFALEHAANLRPVHHVFASHLNAALLRVGSALVPALIVTAAANIVGLLPGLALQGLRAK